MALNDENVLTEYQRRAVIEKLAQEEDPDTVLRELGLVARYGYGDYVAIEGEAARVQQGEVTEIMVCGFPECPARPEICYEIQTDEGKTVEALEGAVRLVRAEDVPA